MCWESFVVEAIGVPRYNDMRRALNMNPIKKWSDLTKDAEYQVCLSVSMSLSLSVCVYVLVHYVVLL